jgi:hypothetical protein
VTTRSALPVVALGALVATEGALPVLVLGAPFVALGALPPVLPGALPPVLLGLVLVLLGALPVMGVGAPLLGAGAALLAAGVLQVPASTSDVVEDALAAVTPKTLAPPRAAKSAAIVLTRPHIGSLPSGPRPSSAENHFSARRGFVTLPDRRQGGGAAAGPPSPPKTEHLPRNASPGRRTGTNFLVASCGRRTRRLHRARPGRNPSGHDQYRRPEREQVR